MNERYINNWLQHMYRKTTNRTDIDILEVAAQTDSSPEKRFW